MKQDMTAILNEVRQMNNEELNDLVEAIKMQRQFLARSTVRSLIVGDRVRFNSGRRGVVEGKVTKVNTKNVKVQQDNAYTVWNVPANMLEKI